MMNQQQEDNTDTLEAMRFQEQSYLCSDYLYQEFSFSRQQVNTPQNSIDLGCRTAMLQWIKTIVKFIGFEPEILEISMSHLDRFLASPLGEEARNCRTIFQLSAMTALYTAVKINCAEALTPKLLAELSHGAFEESQFEHMERIMLSALQWRVNPCTSVSFVRQIVDLLPNNLFPTDGLKMAVLETAQKQAAWTVEDYDLLSVKKSVVAYAAISNSLRYHGIRGCTLQNVMSELFLVDIELDLQHAAMIQPSLRLALKAMEAINNNTSVPPQSSASSEMEDVSTKSIFDDEQQPEPKKLSFGKSPRSVIYRNVAA